MRGGLVIAVAVALAVVAGACGSGGMSDSTGGAPHGDSASFDLGGGSTSVQESGHIELSGQRSPALDYSGPLECKGQFFDFDNGHSDDLLFRYSALDAVLGIGGDVYHFGAPTERGDDLVWEGTFDQKGGSRHVTARVSCPLPTGTTRLLPAT